MVHQLPGGELADITSTNDDCILKVLNLTTTVSARDRTARGNADDPKRPECEECLRHWVRDLRETREAEQEPDPEGHEVKHVNHVLDRGVVCSLLVSLVETMKLGDNDPPR
jgi:hypothetical protein